MAIYRLRSALDLGRSPQLQWQILDPQLKRVVKLGDGDVRLVRALEKGGTVPQLAKQCGLSEAQCAATLSALARLYLLAGKRSQVRVALQAEREAFAQRATAPNPPLLWPPGRDPPRHSCIGTGTCCGATFLGPLLPADHKRVADLTFGSRQKDGQVQRLGHGTPDDDPFEVVHLHGRDHIGMARGDDERCVAQGDDQLCDIHREHGAAAKPVACRLFPLRLHRSPQGVHVSLLLACDGYADAREVGQPWPQRDAEIAALVAEGAPTVRVALPCEWTAGVPVGWTEWVALQAQLFGCEPPLADGRHWLADAIDVAEKAVNLRASQLSEGANVSVAARLGGAVAALRGSQPFYDPERAQVAVAGLQDRAAELRARGRLHDSARLADLAAGVSTQLRGDHLCAPGWSAEPLARRHLHDVVANDLALFVALGHLDAGLVALAARVLFVEALACDLAARAGRKMVTAADTTRALHVAYRSEPDLALLQRAAGGDPRMSDPV